MTKEKLTKRIKVGLTNDEYENLKRYCWFISTTMSEFARKLIFENVNFDRLFDNEQAKNNT